MISYYTTIILLSWLALGVLCVLVSENDRLPAGDKRMLYLAYALIALSALAEWCGVQLEGRAGLSKWMVKAVKCADFILTPMAGGALVWQMRIKGGMQRALVLLLAANTLFQIASFFTDWMIIVGADNRYTNGSLYFVYLLLCLAIIGLVIVAFIVYGRSFRRQNRRSLYAIMGLVIVGILMQEGLDAQPRTTYIAMTLGATMMFIHYSEFSSQAMDDHLTAQQIQIDTDALTGVYSRHAYSRALKAFDTQGLPGDLAAFTVDVNGLKQVNDRMGHDAGDELIEGAARCVETALGRSGRCYRTGGDEFVVLARMDRREAEERLAELERVTKRWRGDKVKALTLAAGYALAADHAGLSAEKLVREADLAMYAVKAAYYREQGRDRRHAGTEDPGRKES